MLGLCGPAYSDHFYSIIVIKDWLEYAKPEFVAVQMFLIFNESVLDFILCNNRLDNIYNQFLKFQKWFAQFSIMMSNWASIKDISKESDIW